MVTCALPTESGTAEEKGGGAKRWMAEKEREFGLAKLRAHEHAPVWCM